MAPKYFSFIIVTGLLAFSTSAFAIDPVTDGPFSTYDEYYKWAGITRVQPQSVGVGEAFKPKSAFEVQLEQQRDKDQEAYFQRTIEDLRKRGMNRLADTRQAEHDKQRNSDLFVKENNLNAPLAELKVKVGQMNQLLAQKEANINRKEKIERARLMWADADEKYFQKIDTDVTGKIKALNADIRNFYTQHPLLRDDRVQIRLDNSIMRAKKIFPAVAFTAIGIVFAENASATEAAALNDNKNNASLKLDAKTSAPSIFASKDWARAATAQATQGAK